MGAWGTGIFSDDDACDLRDEFRQLLGQGMESSEAAQILITREDPDGLSHMESARFWLALAASQMAVGRLTELVKSQALHVIDAGGDLEDWQTERKIASKREKALAKLRAQLCGIQKPPSKIVKRFVQHTQYLPGDAVSYRLLSGKYVVWRIMSIYKFGLSEYPIFEMCDWVGETPDRIGKALTGPRKRSLNYKIDLELGHQFGYADRVNKENGQFMIQARKASEVSADRFQLIGSGLSTKDADENGTFFFWWSELDEDLKRVFGVE